MYLETEMSEHKPLSRTTFNRIRDAVQSLFGVIIECDNCNGHHYYIYNESEVSCPFDSSNDCSKCPCKTMPGDLFLCRQQRCFFSKINIF